MGVKLQCSSEEEKRHLLRVFKRFEKLRVREIGIPLYIGSTVTVCKHLELNFNS